MPIYKRTDIPALILAEPNEPLSEKCTEGTETLSMADDVAVIDWNSAVVRSTGSAMLDVLEFALRIFKGSLL